MADSQKDSCSRNADKDLQYLAQSAQEEKNDKKDDAQFAQEEKNDKNNVAQFAQVEKKEKDDKMVWATRLVSGVHVVIDPPMDASVKPLKRRRHKSPE